MSNQEEGPKAMHDQEGGEPPRNREWYWVTAGDEAPIRGNPTLMLLVERGGTVLVLDDYWYTEH